MKLIVLLLIVGVFTLNVQAGQDSTVCNPMPGETEIINYSPELAKQAVSGDVNAQYKVGLCYYFGLHVKDDVKEYPAEQFEVFHPDE
jgi:hypothetical protein